MAKKTVKKIKNQNANVKEFEGVGAATGTEAEIATASTRREQVILSQDKKEVVSKFARNANDTGSSEVQIALLTQRIQNLTKHFAKHKEDVSSQRGMLALINQRKTLLAYLRETDISKYKATIENLGLRK